MNYKKILLWSLADAAATFLYILLVVFIMENSARWFGNLWSPVAMLTLFVVSAAITGSLVLLRPVILFATGKKTEALMLFVGTVVFLFLVFVAVVTINVASKSPNFANPGLYEGRDVQKK